MAWTNPRAAAVSDVFTAPWYNSEIRDDLLWVVRPLAPPITTEKDVVSSTSTTDLLLPTGLTITGGSIGANGTLRAFLAGDFKNSTGSNQTITLSIVLGGTTLWSSITTTLATAANRHNWIMEFNITNCGAQNSQFLTGVWYYSTSNAAITGLGDLATVATAAAGPSVVPFGSNGKTTVDTASNQTLTVTALLSANSANLSIRREYASFELVGQGA